METGRYFGTSTVPTFQSDLHHHAKGGNVNLRYDPGSKERTRVIGIPLREEREEVLTELLRRPAHGDHPSLSDQEFLEAVNTAFTELDRSKKEPNNGNSHHL